MALQARDQTDMELSALRFPFSILPNRREPAGMHQEQYELLAIPKVIVLCAFRIARIVSQFKG